jgi:hypothetical protein
MSYLPEVFSRLNEIGNVVGFPVGLYRQTYDTVTGGWSWVPIIESDREATAKMLPAYYNYVYNGSNKVVNFFLVCRAGQQNNTNEYVLQFIMSPFPGCCALCISTAASVFEKYRNKGLNRLGIRLREAIAGATGYTGWLCTDLEANSPSIRTIEGNGFKKFYDLRNKRTNNNVNLYIKELD